MLMLKVDCAKPSHMLDIAKYDSDYLHVKLEGVTGVYLELLLQSVNYNRWKHMDM
jgi:hypothetical protein